MNWLSQYSLSLWINGVPDVGLLDHVATQTYFSFFEEPPCCFHHGCTNLHLYQQCFLFSTSSPTLVFLITAILTGAEAGRTPWQGAAAETSQTTSEVRGSSRDVLPRVQGQGWQRRGATPRPRSGAAAERSYTVSEARGSGREEWLCERLRAQRSYSTFKVWRGGSEKIPLVQGKRNPSKTVGVARGHQREDTLKP